MACRITELVLVCADVEAQGRFWSGVLGYVELDREEDAEGLVIELGLPGAQSRPGVPTLLLVPAGDPKREKLRFHLDVNATDRDQDAELRRLLDLGARPADIGQGEDVSWHVLADPEGNEFCLLSSRVDPL